MTIIATHPSPTDVLRRGPLRRTTRGTSPTTRTSPTTGGPGRSAGHQRHPVPGYRLQDHRQRQGPRPQDRLRQGGQRSDSRRPFKPRAQTQGQSPQGDILCLNRPTPSLRLTARGRLVALLLVGVAVLLAAVLVRGSAGAPGASSPDMRPVALRQVTVLPGQTLWSIAAATEPRGDIRDRIAEIRTLNDMESSSLVAGQQLFVPLGR